MLIVARKIIPIENLVKGRLYIFHSFLQMKILVA